MTAPVAVQAPPTTIAMTAPVETAAAGDGRLVMRFFLPSSLTIATAPEPTDPRVRLLVVNERTVAVRRGELPRVLRASSWQVAGEPTSMFYDQPWTMPFLRRNEVTVAVSRR
jgi:hypothetical protein